MRTSRPCTQATIPTLTYSLVFVVILLMAPAVASAQRHDGPVIGPATGAIQRDGRPNGPDGHGGPDTIADRTVDLNAFAPRTLSAADASVSGRALTTTTTNFTASDVGKQILIHGAGAGGISFQTTIETYTGQHAVGLAAAAPKAVSAAAFWWGTDATAGVTAGYDRARRLGLAVTGRGAFWLASQTAPILLSSTSTAPDGGPTQSFSPYTGSGLVFLITSTTVAPFSPRRGGAFCSLRILPGAGRIGRGAHPLPRGV